VADVTFDATGLDPGDYSATLCLASNDPVTPLVMVPLSLTVEEGGGVPTADISPGSFTFEVPAGGSDSDTLNVGNTGTADLVWSIDEAEGTPALLEEWSDDFDGYATGSQIHGQGGWKGWLNDPAAGALVSDAQAQSAPNSVEIVGASDLVHEYVDSTSSQWTYTAWQFIPADFTGISYFILLNSYDDSGSGLNWSTQVNFNASTDTVVNDGASGGTLPLIRDQWVEIRVEIDLDADTQDFFYNGDLLYSGTWTNEVSGGGQVNIGAVDLFANGASPVYYDDLSLSAAGAPGGCAAPTDVPWLSATPASGTTAPGGSEPVDVAVDAAALDPGDYTAQLCVNTNDPTAPLVEVPVNLTVTDVGGPPVADITPDSFAFEVPQGGSDSDTLNVGNIGGEDLTWSLDEAETAIVVPEGAPYRYGLAGAQEFHAPVGSDRASGIRRDRGEAPADRVVLPAPQAQAIGDFTEGFDDITMLPGAGWALINNSEPVGPSSWFQGNGTVFPSHEGEPDAYIAANYESTDDNGTISNWLLTPEVTIVNGTQLCFWTRKTPLFEEFLDRLEVRMSVEGDSTDVGETAESVGDFLELLLTIEPDLELPNEYPEEWTEFCLTVRERPRQPVTGRFAFRYGVTDSGPDGSNGDYIGIDTVSVTQPDDIPPGDGCDNPVDIPWLAVDPASGTTAPGGSEPVTVAVDTAGLEVGEHTAQLCVTTNDPNAPRVEVPVSLTVTGGTTFIETFDDGGNAGNWTFGIPQIEVTESDGGNPGWWLHSTCVELDCLDTFAPQLRTTPMGDDNEFTGNYRQRGVTSVGVDLQTVDADFSVDGRPLTVMLVQDNGTPDDFSDDWAAYYIGDENIPLVGEGWKSFDFAIPSDAEELPPGWQFFAFGGSAPEPSWNTVIEDVSQLRYFYGDPELIFIFQQWELGLDNARITYEPSASARLPAASEARR
ncbi:MAG: choice-of-anchor J domain-containing protein, partial [Thermoanaerobaculia bacterium]